MAKTDFKTIDAYHETFPLEQRKRLDTIRKIIKQVVPEAEEVISYQIPAFKYHGFLIYYAAFTAHTSLSYPYSEALLGAFKEELKSYKVSKSAIQFPYHQELPVDLIKRIIQFRVNENLNKPKKSKPKV